MCRSTTGPAARPPIAAVRHGLPIPDTRRRIKRTATESFKRGGMVMKVKAFYAKVSGEDAAAGTYGPVGLRIRRLIEYAGIVAEIRRRLLEGQSPQSIVAWLNAEGVPCGAYVKSQRWSKKVLRDLLRDPILHGTRTFRDIVHKPIFRTGKYERSKNATPETEYVPELAFMTREEQEAMLAAVGWTIDWGSAKPSQTPHPRKGIPRYQSYWPAQSTTCSISGGMLYASGKYVRCCNSFPHLGGQCWNHLNVPIAALRSAMVSWLVERCNASAEFRDELLKAVKRQLDQQQSRRAAKRDVLAAKVKDLEGQERNLRKSIRVTQKLSDKQIESLVGDLASVTGQLAEMRRQAGSADSSEELVDDYSNEYILEHLDRLLTHLLGTSFEMAEVIRGFVPRCEIVPVQAWDGGQVYPRARVHARENMQDHSELTELAWDLFEPPLHIRHLAEAARLRSQEPQPTLKQIGAALGVSYMTVKRALAYDRLMKSLDITVPFRTLDAKPDSAARWRDAS